MAISKLAANSIEAADDLSRGITDQLPCCALRMSTTLNFQLIQGKNTMRQRPHLALSSVFAFIILLPLVVNDCFAVEKTVIVAVYSATQPFALPDSDSGLQVEIIRAAFASQSTPVTFVFLPSKRKALAYKSG